MPNQQANLNIRAWLLSVVAAGVLAACNGGDSNGNSLPPAGEPGSTPLSTLTFSLAVEGNTPSPAQPSGGVLRTTMSSDAMTNVSLDELQIKVFGPMCSGCHTGNGVTQPSVYDFSSTDASYATLVNQASTAHPSQTLVTPGNSSQSYLMQSLEGTQWSGSRMPMRSKPLNDELLTAVRDWIDAGANKN